MRLAHSTIRWKAVINPMGFYHPAWFDGYFPCHEWDMHPPNLGHHESWALQKFELLKSFFFGGGVEDGSADPATNLQIHCILIIFWLASSSPPPQPEWVCYWILLSDLSLSDLLCPPYLQNLATLSGLQISLINAGPYSLDLRLCYCRQASDL